MAQTITYLHRRRDPAGEVKALEAHQLGVEKLGVIGGFLLGMPIGFGLVGQLAASAGAPGWVTFVLGAVVTAAFTRIGQVLALALTKTERIDASAEDL
jgi:hypothetical protein